MTTFEILLAFLQHWKRWYGDLLKFLEMFMDHFEDTSGLGLLDKGIYISLDPKGKKSKHHPNDLVALIPNRTARRRSSRHAPRPIEMIVGLSALSEAESLWFCHVLPKLPPAFQELMLRRLQDAGSVPEELWTSFENAVLYPLRRVLEGRRVSSLVEGQFNDHLWRLNAEWTRIRLDWIVATKRTAFEGPYDALYQYALCLFQDDPETVQMFLEHPGPAAFNALYAYADLPPSHRADGEFRTKFLALAQSTTFIQALQHPLFHAGAAARRGVVASGPVATPNERAQVVALGEAYGCHHCGHVHPQPKWAETLNYWILDHQPPRSKSFREVMAQGVFLVGPVLTNDLIYDLSGVIEDFRVDEGVKELLNRERTTYRARGGGESPLLDYVKNTRPALRGYLRAMSKYAQDASDKTFYRFFLHCHDCAGLQGGLVQSIVKIAAEITSVRKRMYPKNVAKPREKVYFLQCLAQLHDLLAEAFDPNRPLIRLGATKGGPCSIDGSAASGTPKQRETLVGLSASAGEGIGTRSALGFENPLVLKPSGAACHSCRATVPVPRGLWTADHVSPSFLVELGLRQGPQILYPQCIYCRKAQSVLAAAFKRCWVASKTAKDWDANWGKFLGVTDEGWIDPGYADEDEELLDDVLSDFGSSPDDDEVLPMTGGGVESATVTRVPCLRQEINTCGQRAAYNSIALATHHANAPALKAALEDDGALRAIGGMNVDIDDNEVRRILDGQGARDIAIISSLDRLQAIKADPTVCADAGEFALYSFIWGYRDNVCLVLNTLAGSAAPSDGKSDIKAKVGHYIAVRVTRGGDHLPVATYADSLLNVNGSQALLGGLLRKL